MMLNEEVSKKLKSIIKNGNYDEFLLIVKNENIDPSSYFYAKRDKQCLLYAALCQKFTNKNFEGRIKIANYLIDKGADINDMEPYGYPLIISFIDEILYLKDTNAKVQVYMETIKLAIQIVLDEHLDVHLVSRHESSVLDSALKLHALYIERPEFSFDGVLVTLTARLLDELIKKGAKLLEEHCDSDLKIVMDMGYEF